MGHYVSIRHNGSLAQVPTSWLCLGILVPVSALLAADRLYISNLGIALWIATAAVCLFMALIAHAAQAERSRTLFFLAAGLFTLWLGLDDLFHIREDVLPRFGMAKQTAYAAYAATAGAYAAAHWRVILASRPFLLLLAGVAFAASMGFDTLHYSESLSIMTEDGLKFLGIAFWAGFHLAAAATTAEALVTGRVTTVAVSSGRFVRRLA